MSAWRRVRDWLAEPGRSLPRRVAHGGVWAFLANVSDKLLQLVRLVVLARLLAPEDFGLFGITLLALSALDRFTRTGFEEALVQKRGEDRLDLDTTWVVQVVRGVAMGAVLAAVAPWVAGFFEEPGAAPLVRVLGLVAVVRGFRNIGVIFFQKEIEFHREFVFRLSATVPDLVVSVAAAVLFRNAWALLAGLVAGAAVQSVASYWLHPHRPRLRFDLERARELFDFGKYLTAQSVVLFLLTEGDDALVGKVLGAASLGFYQIAYRLSNLATTEIRNVVSGVAFPTYAKLQDRPEKLRRGLRRSLGLIAFLALPVAAAVAALAPEITVVFLGEKWLPMVPAMQLLCLFGALRAVASTFGPLYQALARVDVPLRVNVVQLVLLASVIYPMTTRWGIVGASAAITLAMAVSTVHTSVRAGQVAGIGLPRLYAPAVPAVAGTAAALASVVLARPAVASLAPTPIPRLTLLAAAGAGVYLLVAVVTFRVAGHRLADLRSLASAAFGGRADDASEAP